MSVEARQKAYDKGVMAEEMAVDHLQGQGCEIVAQRYKTRFGEVDVVATREDLLIFVEVKARKTYAEGAEAVTFKARRRIENAALYFMGEHDEYRDFGMRFDVVVVSKAVDGSGVISVDHLDNAWQAGQ